MARELGDFNVRVNAITPGPVYTEIARATVTPEQKVAMLKAQCLKHHETPQDLVGVAASWLRTTPALSPARRSTATAASRSSR